jgi:HK97 family phage major capsid protein
MSTESGPDGGFVVQPELEKRITRYQRDISPMRRLARVVATKAGDYEIPIATSGLDSGWVTERGSRSETDGPALALNNYPVHEIYANPSVTQKLLDDAVEDIGAYLAEEVAQAFDEKEGDAFVNGDGVGKPMGFLQKPTSAAADSARAHGTLQFVETAGVGAITHDDLITMSLTPRAAYRRNAHWLMSSTTVAHLAKLKDGEARHVYQPSLALGVPATLLGYPVEVDETMPTVAAGAYPIAFGDFQRGYVIVDRMGIRLLRDALTNKPFVQFYTTKRVGGGVHDSNAIKLLKIKAA